MGNNTIPLLIYKFQQEDIAVEPRVQEYILFGWSIIDDSYELANGISDIRAGMILLILAVI